MPLGRSFPARILYSCGISLSIVPLIEVDYLHCNYTSSRALTFVSFRMNSGFKCLSGQKRSFPGGLGRLKFCAVVPGSHRCGELENAANFLFICRYILFVGEKMTIFALSIFAL